MGWCRVEVRVSRVVVGTMRCWRYAGRGAVAGMRLQLTGSGEPVVVRGRGSGFAESSGQKQARSGLS
jgi:hypothetical protein